jgi:hypothetical protein
MPIFIAGLKRSVVPVLTHDSTWALGVVHQGTAVLIGDTASKTSFALSCAHVVAAGVDANGLPAKPASSVTLGLPRIDGSTFLMPAQVVYFDAQNDMALCQPAREMLPQQYRRIGIAQTVVPTSQWKGMSDVHEGDQLLCIGLPVSKGSGGRSYPLSRTSIVSQVVPGQGWFVMDGFVQHGNSGSPVFLLKQEGDSIPLVWTWSLVGIARSFAPTDSLLAEANPGFTYVTALENLFPELSKLGLHPMK